MISILAIAAFIALLIIVSLYVFTKFIMAVKRVLLTEEIAWSAKSLKIRRKGKTLETIKKDGTQQRKLLEDIAEQSSEFLKDQ